MRVAGWTAVAVALSGCSSLSSQSARMPDLPVTVAEIQRAVACEFAYALDTTDGDGRKALRTWGAVVELTLIAKDTVNITPGMGALSAKVGNATISTTATTPGMVFDGSREDKNTLTYVGPIEKQARTAQCPDRYAPDASTGLELAELLIGTAQVINSGGSITSSAAGITAVGIGPSGTGAVVSAGTVFPVATGAVREDIPTVKYERTFTVSRKLGGGLSFKVGDLSLSLSASATGRDRTNNKIVISMGPQSVTKTSTDQADLEGDVGAAASETISLEESILRQREKELELLRGLLPKEVIVVNPPAGP